METKTCSRCKLEKDEKDFHKSNTTKDGRQVYCKICNKDCYPKERRRDYNIRRQVRRQDPLYKKKEADLGKKMRIQNRERYLFKGIKARCVYKKIKFNLEVSDIIIPEKCPVLGIKLTTGKMYKNDWDAPSVDRIKPELGYVKGNIIVMSRRANVMKNQASWEQLESFCKGMLRLVKKWKENEK